MQQTERKCQTVWVERGWQWHFPHLEILYLLIKLQHICQILWELFLCMLCMFLCACTSLYWINLPLMPSVCDYIVLGLIPISWTVKQCRYREMTRRHDCNPLHSTFFVWCFSGVFCLVPSRDANASQSINQPFWSRLKYKCISTNIGCITMEFGVRHSCSPEDDLL